MEKEDEESRWEGKGKAERGKKELGELKRRRDRKREGRERRNREIEKGEKVGCRRKSEEE